MLRAVSWNLIDQALSALSNIILSVAVARSVSAGDFGAFSMAFVVFGIAIALTKSLVGQPLQIRFAASGPRQQRRAVADGCGAALLLGLAGAALLVVVSLFVPPVLREALLALALVLPGLLVQDSCRMAFFALGRARSAAAIDAVWAILMVGLLALLVATGYAGVWQLTAAWGAGAAVAAVLGLVLLRTGPAVGRAAGWLRGHWDLTRYLFPEYVLGLGAMQLAILLVGLIAAADAVGALRAAQVLLGPLGIVATGVFQFSVPEIARRRQLGTRRLTLFAAAISGGLCLVTAAYLAVLLLLPDRVGTALFGDSWPGAAAVLLAMGLSSVFSCLANGPAGVLYGLGLAKNTFRIHLAKGPVLLVVVLVATWNWGAVGAAWGLAFVEAVVLPAWVLTMLHGLRSRPAQIEDEPGSDAENGPPGQARAGTPPEVEGGRASEPVASAPPVPPPLLEQQVRR